jgi:hypothetical protein
MRERLQNLPDPVRMGLTIASAVVAVGLVGWGVVALAGAVFGGGGDSGAPINVNPSDSSWVPGQPSLIKTPGYAALAGRAAQLGNQRFAARLQLIAQIAAAKKAAEDRAREKAREEYLRKRAEALRKYAEAQRRAAIIRARQQKAAAIARAKYLAAKRAYEKKLKVNTGAECNDPDVKQQYKCQTGKLPAGKPK